MATTQLEKKDWHSYFDRVSKALTGRQVEIEVNSLALGSQLAASWIPLLGITYDAKEDMLEVLLEGLDHRIPRPVSVFVDQEGDQLQSMVVSDGQTQQIVRFRTPLSMSAPT